jgi:type I restriction enzyme S subunit
VETLVNIPEGWEMDNISEICELVDYRGKTPEKVDMGTFLVTAKNIRNGKIDYNISKEFVRTEKYGEIMSRGLPKIGDVLITTEAPLGEVASVDNESIALAQRIIKLRGKKEKLENKYLKYFLLSEEFQKGIKNDATGSTVEGIKGSRLKKQVIKFPKSPKEQLAITDILVKVDKNIEKTEQTIEKYKKIKNGLMDDLLTGKIRIENGKWVKETEFREVEGVGKVPEDWEVRDLGQYTCIEGGYAFSSSDYCSNGIQLLKIGNVFGNELCLERDQTYLPLNFANWFSKYIIKNEDIIISMTGTIGKRDYGYAVKIQTKDNVFLLNQRLGKFVPKNNIDSDFLLYILHGNYFLNKLYTRAGGTKQANLTNEQILSILICSPDLEEQKQISCVLCKQDHLIEKEEKYLQKLKKLKAGLMEDLLTGKVRVKLDN